MKASNPSLTATLHQQFKGAKNADSVGSGRNHRFSLSRLSQLRLVALMLRFVHPFKHFVVVAIHPQRAIGFLRSFILPLDI